MKKIDRLLLGSFIPPFLVAFTIAMFVLVMQTLWVYIDDIAGKGLGPFLILELLAYKCVSLIPLALPIGVLISSVMVMGNLAERYELSSIKSAGVSLIRVMRPLMLFTFGCAWFSYYSSVSLIPRANLKFGSRMYDIQQQKPTLKLDAGIFNYDFEGFAIHIGEKDPDGRGIKDVLIYDHTSSSKGEYVQIAAREGEMFTTPEGDYFVMRLRDGHQYVESKGRRSTMEKTYPFVRISFQEWTKVFNLQEFQLSRTDENLFKASRSTLSPQQLKVVIDSLGDRLLSRKLAIANYLSNYLHPLQADSSLFEEEAAADPGIAEAADSITLTLAGGPAQSEGDTLEGDGKAKEKSVAYRRLFGGRPMEQIPPDSLDKPSSIIQTFPSDRHQSLYNRAVSFARSIYSQAQSTVYTVETLAENRVKHIYELHMRYSMAVACFIFVFIGAPMGAIVRKGGFGYPILISILFFTLFVILMIMCRKLAESFVVPGVLAAWLPCLVVFPMGLILTNKARKDSKILDADRYLAFFRRFKKKKKS
ncbi:MAG: LptF/LptG family permease [Saprospiraceae bacterium]|nr:LptF/LptG family permease [Saprospiraceae bacterium]